MAILNVDSIAMCRSIDSSFEAMTADWTREKFNTIGYGPIQSDPMIRNKWYAVDLTWRLQKVMFSKVKDLLEEQGFGESFSGDFGSYIAQRLYSHILPCVNPAYMEIEEGKEYGHAPVRLHEIDEDFWVENEDIMNIVSLPDDFQWKGIFENPYGMDVMNSGKANALAEGVKLQKYLIKKDLINYILTNDRFPLTDAQKVEVKDIEMGDVDSITEFLTALRRVVRKITFTSDACGGMFNAKHYADAVNKDDLVLLIRPDTEDLFGTISKLNETRNMEIPVKTVYVEDFGGVVPVINESQKFAAGKVYLVSDDATPTYTEYKALVDAEATNTVEATVVASLTGATKTLISDKLGVVKAVAYYLSTGIATTGSGQSEVTYKTIYVPKENAAVYDPHEDTLAVLADRRVIFQQMNNNQTVEADRDSYRKITHFIFTLPKNMRGYDPHMTVVEFKKKQS